jgi:hypothetical protein
MNTLSYVLRVISLSFLFAGSTSIIFAALALVHAGQEQGIEPTVTAAANAPMFTMFSTVVFVCAILLLIAEALDYAKTRSLSLPIKARYIASFICVVAAFVLKLGIIPQMEQLTLKDPDNQKVHAVFKKFHQASRVDFTLIIVASLISLLMPGFEASRKIAAKKSEEASAIS